MASSSGAHRGARRPLVHRGPDPPSGRRSARRGVDPAPDLRVHPLRQPLTWHRAPGQGPERCSVSPCPQICTQVGESGHLVVRSRALELRRRSGSHTSSPGSPHVVHCGRSSRRLVPRGWGLPEGGQGRAGGEATRMVHSGRVVHVSTQGRGHQPTASQQGQTAVDLRKGVRSPASTRVMTKMSYICRGVLEPHSGWGQSGPPGSPTVPGDLQDTSSARSTEQLRPTPGPGDWSARGSDRRG